MAFPSDNPSPTANPAKAAAGAGDQAPQAPGVQPPDPRLVIRGESSRTFGQRGDGVAFGAITDWLNLTFPLPSWKDIPGSFFLCVNDAVGPAFGHMESTGRGLHGYTASCRFQWGKVQLAFGGQRETGFLSIPGDGCALVPDWNRLVSVFRDGLGARITRWDGAVDDFEGIHSIAKAVDLYLAGAFNAGGRKPGCDQNGNWIEPDGTGRTFYVGSRRNGKLLRVYEKGMQLGDRTSPWVRWEVELHNVDRVIPWEVIADPASFMTGAYPALCWISGVGSRIPTLRRADTISYERIVHYARVAYGPLVDVILEREGTAEKVVDRLWRAGIPRRLETTTLLGVHKMEDCDA